METEPILNGQPDPTWPTAPDSCPISELLGKRIVDMTDEELEQHVVRMRSARESPQIMRSLLKGKEKTAKVAKPKKKINLADLGL